MILPKTDSGISTLECQRKLSGLLSQRKVREDALNITAWSDILGNTGRVVVT